MPSELRQIGPPFVDGKGETRTPRALLSWCEDCGAANAAFGIKIGDQVLTYCGWVDGEPKCVNRDERE